VSPSRIALRRTRWTGKDPDAVRCEDRIERSSEPAVPVSEEEADGGDVAAEVHQEVASGLGDPLPGRMRRQPGQMCLAGAMFDGDQCIDPFENTVSTRTKSTARKALARAVRNWRQLGPDRRGAGSRPASCRICHTVEAAMRWPSRTSSPYPRRCPQAGCSVAMRITMFVIAAGVVGGRPGWRRAV
jgi:hypothetical protein